MAQKLRGRRGKHMGKINGISASEIRALKRIKDNEIDTDKHPASPRLE
jgi:hypothetical protein